MAEGNKISVDTAKGYMQNYIDIKKIFGPKIIECIDKSGLDPDIIKRAKQFYLSLNNINTFVFDADLIGRFFNQPNEKPDHFIIVLGSDETATSPSTVLTAGCIETTKTGDLKRSFKVLSVLPTNEKISEHPGKASEPIIHQNLLGNQIPEIFIELK